VKITGIETIALVDPGKASETIVRVHTDEGIDGIGQAESPSLVIDAIIKTSGGLEDILIGEDPLQVERLWQKMYSSTGLFGRRGVTIAAIGAVETALWDIAGKALGKPVSELIWHSCCTVRETGEIKPKVTPYATVYPPGETEEEMRERFGKAIERGFQAVKLEE
jgi:L-alanine-DL-glutamate epimerase-like enolase superfamily enzyme